jgi:hypothetical protein
VVYFVGFFAKLGHFVGFSLNNNAVWISEAAMGGAGDIILYKNETKKLGRMVAPVYINFDTK